VRRIEKTSRACCAFVAAITMSDCSDSTETRKCKGPCGRERDIAQFSPMGRVSRRGKQYRRFTCRSCDSRESCERRLRRKENGPRPRECMNCESVEPLACDHDHQTGKFRGWLCKNCNTGLGLLGDDAAGLRRMLADLERSSAAHSGLDDEERARSRSPHRDGDSRGAAASPLRSPASVRITGSGGRPCSTPLPT
jgi:hypothetical protein